MSELGRGVKSDDYCVLRDAVQQVPFTENEPGLSRANSLKPNFPAPFAYHSHVCVYVCVREPVFMSATVLEVLEQTAG